MAGGVERRGPGPLQDVDARLRAVFERLAAAGIQLLPLPGITTHYVLERDGFAALVERAADGFGQIGSAGRVTEQGLAVLLWRNGQPFFVTKNSNTPAGETEVATLRRFTADVEQALAPRYPPKKR